MKIAGMMRVKNEARWIERCVRSMMPLCEHVFVLDDHSSDGTPHIIEKLPNTTVYYSPWEKLHEARDKNWLIERVEDYGADWVLHIDGDEEVMPPGCDILRILANRAGGSDCYRLRVLYLWNREDQIRVDRWYSDYSRPSFFKLRPGARFSSPNGGGFHCGNVPGVTGGSLCDAKLLHYGYMHREDRIRKFHWYNAPDKQPVPDIEDGYRHMVIGDLFPADSAFRYAGPLKLQVIER
jgi:glycosyltransferase involved in cell wall biosynthesis